jgi:hypothetical protein
MSGILTELFPYMYHAGRNELIGYIECLEPELDYIRDRYKGLTALIDVNTCPEDYLPYLAAMINCPLIGNDPRKWRVQIKAWPEILRTKGTEASVVTLLEKVGLTQVHVDTYWRDGGGNYTTERPTEAPVYDAGAGVWLNSRTHYFTLALSTPSGELLSTEDMATIKRLLPYVKPHHAEILEYQLYGRFEDICESDELLDARSLTLISEQFPWLGAYYNGLHRYAAPDDPSALLYGDVSECEEFYNQIKNDFHETLWAQYKYNGELTYDGSVRYGIAAIEHEVLYLGHQIAMYDTAAETEGFNHTLLIFI